MNAHSANTEEKQLPIIPDQLFARPHRWLCRRRDGGHQRSGLRQDHRLHFPGGLEKKVLNCACCVEYPRASLGSFIEKVRPARANLEEVRGSLKKRAQARKSKKNPSKKK